MNEGLGIKACRYWPIRRICVRAEIARTGMSISIPDPKPDESFDDYRQRIERRRATLAYWLSWKGLVLAVIVAKVLKVLLEQGQ